MIGNAITIDWPAKRADARAIDTQAHHYRGQDAAGSAGRRDAIDGGDERSRADEAAYDGVGGPDEPVDASGAIAAAAPATSYRACAPGPGDDNCIQLYEPGVARRAGELGREPGERRAARDGRAGRAGRDRDGRGDPATSWPLMSRCPKTR